MSVWEKSTLSVTGMPREEITAVRGNFFAGADDPAGDAVLAEQERQHIAVTGVVAAAGDDVNFAVPVPALKQA